MKEPKEWVPAWSRDFVVGFNFLYRCLEDVEAAFLRRPVV